MINIHYSNSEGSLFFENMERSFIVSLPNLSPVDGEESGAEMVQKNH